MDRRRERRTLFAGCVAAAVLALVVAAVEPSIHAEGSRGEHWVGTWSTAVVARPQGPAAAGGGFGAAVPQCFGPAPQAASTSSVPAAPPGAGGRGQGGGRGGNPPTPVNFNNQTLR